MTTCPRDTYLRGLRAANAVDVRGTRVADTARARLAFLALRYAPEAATANLRRLVSDFPELYGKWGFRDSVNVQTKRASSAYLALDQGMIMAALGNALGGDVLRRDFADRGLERSLRPVIGIERFNTAP